MRRVAWGEKHRVAHHDYDVDPFSRQGGEDRIDVFGRAGFYDYELDRHRRGRGLCFLALVQVADISGVHQQCDAGGAGDEVARQFELLGGKPRQGRQ